MKFSRFAKIGAVASVLAFGAAAASASTVTSFLKFNGSGGYASSYTFGDGPLSVTATGHLLNSDGSIGALKTIGQWSGGLGVKSDRYDEHFVDSNGNDEVVKIVFNMAVKIEKIWFTYVDYHDDFSFSAFAGSTVSAFYQNLDIAGIGDGSYTFKGDWVSNMFGIGAYGSGDAFKIKAMQVSYGMAPIPLPAAGWLLLAGLGGLAAMRRTRRRA